MHFVPTFPCAWMFYSYWYLNIYYNAESSNKENGYASIKRVSCWTECSNSCSSSEPGNAFSSIVFMTRAFCQFDRRKSCINDSFSGTLITFLVHFTQFFRRLMTIVIWFLLHWNLGQVRLIGYCVEGSLFLVYEYIENGNLGQHLRGSGEKNNANYAIWTWTFYVLVSYQSSSCNTYYRQGWIHFHGLLGCR